MNNKKFNFKVGDLISADVEFYHIRYIGLVFSVNDNTIKIFWTSVNGKRIAEYYLGETALKTFTVIS